MQESVIGNVIQLNDDKPGIVLPIFTDTPDTVTIYDLPRKGSRRQETSDLRRSWPTSLTTTRARRAGTYKPTDEPVITGPDSLDNLVVSNRPIYKF